MSKTSTLAEQHLDRLRTDWPSLTQRVPPAPALSWEDWKEALLGFTQCREHEFLVRSALAAIMKQAEGKPGYLVLEDLLIVAIASHNDTWSFLDSIDKEVPMG